MAVSPQFQVDKVRCPPGYSTSNQPINRYLRSWGHYEGYFFLINNNSTLSNISNNKDISIKAFLFQYVTKYDLLP